MSTQTLIPVARRESEAVQAVIEAGRRKARAENLARRMVLLANARYAAAQLLLAEVREPEACL